MLVKVCCSQNCHNGNHKLNRIQSDPFHNLQELHALKSFSFEIVYKLTPKALSPTNFERQNVNLVLQIFSEYTIRKIEMFA